MIVGFVTFLITFSGAIVGIFKYLFSIKEQAKQDIEAMTQANFDFRISHQKAMGELATLLEKDFAKKDAVYDLYEKYNGIHGDIQIIKGKLP